MKDFIGCLTFNAPEDIRVSPYEELMEERHGSNYKNKKESREDK
jgi:hypothetical protein